ncbi:MAG: YifB family Mg chelatase-like AAA ATPase [Oscillospiraceae bacterium]|nr:YifB family Mg chelatase-like AAA ATPase [Oscillospiraceae bacterium]
MTVKAYCAALSGLDGNLVTIEADLSGGLPHLDIVGLPDAAVRESRERVRSAITNSGYEFPSRRCILNLAPADLKKEGTQYDLPIAAALLLATGQLSADLESCLLMGELSLSGEIRGVNGVLSGVICAKNSGFKSVIVPAENAAEAALVSGIDVYGAKTLSETVLHLSGEQPLSKIESDIENIFEQNSHYNVDFDQVRGQLALRRGIEIATAGGHNVLLIGSPGSGKTMIAQRIPTILPDLTMQEALDLTQIYSVAGELKDGQSIISCRPFRAPHHSSSTVSIVGGGPKAKPGELSLAHNGVLFFDELPEYGKSVMEAMRQPLEDKTVTVSRIAATCTYPCNVMFVAAMNPCRCGYYGDGSGRCHCSEPDVRRYLGKVSGPLLDRIDIQLEASTLRYSDLTAEKGESSAEIKKRVNAARKIQQERFKDEGITCNAQMNSAQIERFCPLGPSESALLKNVFDVMGLSARAYSRILKVARTIADVAGRENITDMDISEAVGYRTLDRKYWN